MNPIHLAYSRDTVAGKAASKKHSRKPARDFYSCAALVPAPTMNFDPAPLREILDERVLPELARLFLAGRTSLDSRDAQRGGAGDTSPTAAHVSPDRGAKNTTAKKPTSPPVGKEN